MGTKWPFGLMFHINLMFRSWQFLLLCVYLPFALLSIKMYSLLTLAIVFSVNEQSGRIGSFHLQTCQLALDLGCCCPIQDNFPALPVKITNWPSIHEMIVTSFGFSWHWSIILWKNTLCFQIIHFVSNLLNTSCTGKKVTPLLLFFALT